MRKSLFLANLAVCFVALFGSLIAFAEDNPTPGLGATFSESAIAAETPRQTVANLWRDTVSQEFIDTQETRGFSEREALLEKMPRVARLLNIARNGTAAEKTALRAALTEYCDAYVNRIPSGLDGDPATRRSSHDGFVQEALAITPGEVSVLNVDSSGVMAVPIVMLEAGVNPRDLLWWLAQMNRRFQQVSHGYEGTSEADSGEAAGEWLIMVQVDIYAGVADKILRKMLEEQKSSPQAFVPREKEALAAFAGIIDAMARMTARTVAQTEDTRLKQEIAAHDADSFSSAQALNILRVVERFLGMSNL